MGGDGCSKDLHNLELWYQNDVPVQGVEDKSSKQKKMGQKEAHGLGHGHLHGRVTVPESGNKGKEREMEGNMDVSLDSLSLDLDTDFTTKS